MTSDPKVSSALDQSQERLALRGAPSYVWREGQKRRFDLINHFAGSRIVGSVLDLGCGVGVYLQRFAQRSDSAFGLEYDFQRARVAQEQGLSITCADGVKLPYPTNHFDLVLSHEVLEHVANDRAALEEIVRVLRLPYPAQQIPGGRLIIFVPNRGYPFETHGIYWRGRYLFGNFAFVNYLPHRVRDKIVPHVRVYNKQDLERVFQDLPLRVIHRTILFGAYDNIIARWPRPGKLLRSILHFFEKTPLRAFGLSHFWILERVRDT
ncbi:MAG: class I SAM-dependent methyltransferase [Chloroflexi bacterium]|nr:class I SAM-dependent methyltransferase [Chloroflexota bacterium]